MTKPTKPANNENPEHPKDTQRLQVVLARFGVASRRGVVSMIEDGKVTVNGKVVLEKGFRVNTAQDEIEVDGQKFSAGDYSEKRYFMLNKPRGVMTTLQDPYATKVVADFFQDVSARLFPVGRLDRDTTGLLIMTNDGELAFRLTHPSFGVKKRYIARIEGVLSEKNRRALETGIELEDGVTAPCRVEVESVTPYETTVFVTIHEGKKRQIRRVFEQVGHFVLELERLSYGCLNLGDLRFGQKRELTAGEVLALKTEVGLVKNAQVTAPKKRPPARKRSAPKR